MHAQKATYYQSKCNKKQGGGGGGGGGERKRKRLVVDLESSSRQLPVRGLFYT